MSWIYVLEYTGIVNLLGVVTRTIHPLGPGEKEDNNPHHIGTFKYYLKVREQYELDLCA